MTNASTVSRKSETSNRVRFRACASWSKKSMGCRVCSTRPARQEMILRNCYVLVRNFAKILFASSSVSFEPMSNTGRARARYRPACAGKASCTRRPGWSEIRCQPGDVLLDEAESSPWDNIQRDAGERAGRRLGFFLEEGDAPVGVGGDGIVFFYLLQVAHVIDGERRRIFARQIVPEIAQLFAEQIVTRDHERSSSHVLGFEDVIDVANRAELVGVVRWE